MTNSITFYENDSRCLFDVVFLKESMCCLFASEICVDSFGLGSWLLIWNIKPGFELDSIYAQKCLQYQIDIFR